MEDITRFPKVRNLALNIEANGHSCGPSLYHVLRMCTGVRKLNLTLADESGSPEVILSFLCLYLVRSTRVWIYISHT
jgi:hypothetical protein